MILKWFLPAVCALCTVCVSAQEKKKIVVASTPDTEISKQIIGLFIDELGKGLTKSGKYEVLQNRKEFAGILGEEVEFQSSGLVDDNEQLEVGRALGAEYACYVTIRQIGRNFNITCKFLNLSTGTSIGEPFSMATKNGEDDLIDIAYSMSLKLASNQDITVRRQTFVTMTKFHPNVYGEIVDYNISIQDEEAMTYSEAVEFCKNKGEGWRLPSKEELLFIYRNRIHVEKRGAKPFGRKDYWSVSRRNNYESFVVSFSTGREVYYSRNIKNVFRCVREP